jgi:hypothetical protein
MMETVMVMYHYRLAQVNWIIFWLLAVAAAAVEQQRWQLEVRQQF